jgi:hypothetical protein
LIPEVLNFKISGFSPLHRLDPAIDLQPAEKREDLFVDPAKDLQSVEIQLQQLRRDNQQSQQLQRKCQTIRSDFLQQNKAILTYLSHAEIGEVWGNPEVLKIFQQLGRNNKQLQGLQ